MKKLLFFSIFLKVCLFPVFSFSQDWVSQVLGQFQEEQPEAQQQAQDFAHFQFILPQEELVPAAGEPMEEGDAQQHEPMADVLLAGAAEDAPDSFWEEMVMSDSDDQGADGFEEMTLKDVTLEKVPFVPDFGFKQPDWGSNSGAAAAGAGAGAADSAMDVDLGDTRETYEMDEGQAKNLMNHYCCCGFPEELQMYIEEYDPLDKALILYHNKYGWPEVKSFEPEEEGESMETDADDSEGSEGQVMYNSQDRKRAREEEDSDQDDFGGDDDRELPPKIQRTE